MADRFRTNQGIIDLKDKPLIMGIVNVTPDSFSDGGKYYDQTTASEHALRLVDDGADILDIGGESTRPGAKLISEQEEIRRVIPVIRQIKKQSNIPVSIDTSKSIVAHAALEEGANIVNDISALRFDDKMAEVISSSGAAVILMHMLGTPKTMQVNIHYDSLLKDIKGFLLEKVKYLEESGVERDKILIDPGIGFGKTVEHNLEIIRNIPYFTETGYPVVIGASRKSFIGKVLDLDVEQRVEGTLAVDAYCTINDVDIIRTHDVEKTKRVVNMTKRIHTAQTAV